MGKVTDEVEVTLIASFQNGLNVVQACLQAGISKDTFYYHCNKDPDFATRMSKAQEFVGSKARQNLVKKINAEDDGTSKWWLERRDPEFKPKSEVDATVNPVDKLLEAYGVTGGGDARETQEAPQGSSESKA